MQYACQLASATNDIWFIFTKYTTELRDCTMFKQQHSVFVVAEKACRNLTVLISNCHSMGNSISVLIDLFHAKSLQKYTLKEEKERMTKKYTQHLNHNRDIININPLKCSHVR